MGRGFMLVMMVLLPILFLGSASAHEQKQYTIILGSEKNSPENASVMLVGDGAYFRMEDSRENMSHNVSVDLDGDGDFDDWSSGTLVHSCDVNENGSRLDENCSKTALLIFNSTDDVGTYVFRVVLSDGSVRLGNITISPDIHEEEGVPPMGYCIGADCSDDEQQVKEDVSTSSVMSQERKLLLAAAMLFGGIGTFLLLSGSETRILNEEE